MELSHVFPSKTQDRFIVMNRAPSPLRACSDALDRSAAVGALSIERKRSTASILTLSSQASANIEGLSRYRGDSSEARSMAIGTISSGSSRRPIGVETDFSSTIDTPSRFESYSSRRSFILVRTGPEQMALTVIPSRATSSASVRVRPSRPCSRPHTRLHESPAASR